MAITFALHAFHTHIPDIPILIRSFTCTLSQAVDSQCKLEWYIVAAYCAFQFNQTDRFVTQGPG